MKNFRIVMLTAQFMPEANGGAEQQCFKLSQQLQQYGCSITILTSRINKKVPAYEEMEGIKVIRLLSYGPPQLLSFKYLHASFIWFNKCVRWLKQHKNEYDLIHMHQAKFNAFTGLYACKLLRKRSIVKIGNSGYGFDLLTLKRKAFIGKMLHRYVVQHIDIAIAISRDIQQELLAEKIPAHKIIFLPNGVEVKITQLFSPAGKMQYRKQLNLPLERKIFLFAGRLEKQKDILGLIDSFAGNNPIENNYFLLLLGDGEMRKEVEKRINEKGLNEVISLKGYQKNVWPFLLAADFFVLSTKAEGLSNALLEAMSVGLIPISNEVSGSKDLITPGTNGFLAQVGSNESMRQAIKSAGNLTPQLVECYRINAFNTIREQYEMGFITKKYLELYNQMLTA
ncbi:glycosyltransferase [Ilyomonas limi]|uniref:Glycosyltransferase n=1 Tax=Ilyomonas limi TaxID=2575867 RepID=A0A4U3KZL7_9BACT|nr:glycosyltransferase [Ilyomonas limi]TKK67980.1 glycosyltransferase [Ilyomonas limi]